MPEGFLTTDEVAKMHEVTSGRVSQWIRSGLLNAEKPNRDWMIKKEDAESFKPPVITGRPRKNEI